MWRDQQVWEKMNSGASNAIDQFVESAWELISDYPQRATGINLFSRLIPPSKEGCDGALEMVILWFNYLYPMNVLRQRGMGFFIAFAAVALVVGWRMLIVSTRPDHLQAAAAEFASVGKFVLSPPMANKACNKLLFCQSTEHGVGVFLLDIPSRQKRLIYEQSQKNFDPARFRLLGWAPDDSAFAFQGHKDDLCFV